MFTASASDSSADGEPETLYQVLGIAETAGIEEIKRTYYRLVRQYRPNEHPEKFQRFNEAHHTLSDPRRRGEYDQIRRSGRRVQVIVDQAAVSLEKDPQKAVTLLRNAIALAPDVPRPRHLLAYALMRMEEHSQAEKQYRWLIKGAPRDESLRFRLARCLFTQGHLDEAEQELTKALYINPRYHDALMLSGKIAERVADRRRAVETLEKAIANDGKENLADLEAFLRLLTLRLQASDAVAVEAVERRILAIMPSDESRAARGVNRLMKRSAELLKDGDARNALHFARLAGRIECLSEEKRAEVASLEKGVLLIEEGQRIALDPLVDPSLQSLFQARYVDLTSESIRGAKITTAFEALRDRIRNEPQILAGAVEYLRREYPTVAADDDALLQEIALHVAKRVELLSAASRSAKKEQAPFVMPGASTKSSESGDSRRGILGIFRGQR
jgi:curved DNA-binding protein CbpA